MKLTVILTLFACLQVSANGYSQKVTLQVKDAPLENIFMSIKAQTGYGFFFDQELMKQSSPVTVDIKNAELETVLNICFQNQPLMYSIVGQTIVVKEKPKTLLSDLDPNAVVAETQFQEVTGRVTDESGRPLEGVSVLVRGTRTGTSTDQNGHYKLNIDDPQNAVLDFSMVGFEAASVAVRGRTTVNVFLRQKVSTEQEVVITGYYQLPRERVTGSFSRIDEQQLESITSMSLKDKLEGLVPGLLFDPTYNNDQDPSTERSTGITIRGAGTLGDRSPLIVVDGFPVISSDGVDPWSTINPNDVANITVLKDAAAASIWGAQAANGVIVITTKSGSMQSGSSVGVNIEFLTRPKPDLYQIPFATSQEAIDIYKHLFFETAFFNSLTSAYSMSRYDFPPVIDALVKRKAGLMNDQELKEKLDQLAQIDVRDEFSDLFLRRDSYQKATISFNNRTKDNNLRASLMTMHNNNYNKRNGSSQVIGNINNTFSPTKWISLQFGLNMSLQNSELNGADIRDLQYIPQNSRILDDDGNYLPMIKNNIDFYYTVPTRKRRALVSQYDLPYDWDWNLKREVDNMDITQKTRDIRANGVISFKPVSWANIDLSYQYQTNNSLYSNYMNEETWYVRNNVLNYYRTATGQFPIPTGGMLYERKSDFVSQSGRLQGTINKTLGEHSIKALGGIEMRSDNRESIPYGYYGYNPQSLTQITSIDFNNRPAGAPLSTGLGVLQPIAPIPTLRATSIRITGRNDRFLSYYGNAGYTYKGKYDVTGSIRMDKTNLYGRSASYRELPQWSAGVGYTLSNESFFHIKAISYLKIRAAYGWNGHIDKNASPYITAIPWIDPINQSPYAAVLDAPNPGLTWEKTKNINLGIDFALFDNRLRGTVEVYRKNSTNVLADFEVNPTYGFYYDGATLNQGDIENRGTEIELQGIIINSKKVKWRSLLNYSHNKNKVVNIEVAAFNIAARANLSQFYPVPGQPIDYIAVVDFAGYDDQGLFQAMYHGKPENILNIPYVGADLDDLFIFAGQRSPKHFGSWINNISFANFELSARMLYSFGHKVLGDAPPRNTLYYIQLPSSFFTFLPGLMVDRWKSPADNATAAMYGIDTRVTNYTATITSDILSEYNTRNLLNAGHIRLQSISLTYRVPHKVLGKTMKSASVMLQARNLGPIYRVNKQGVDPMFPKYSGSLYAAYFNTIRSRPDYSITFKVDL
ncbi:MAG: SusC/RagA family TonB-linked outer membrane protein [Chitinophagaceae bacterium]|nr:SusC/RagA family TonB-linked outer membrane protein [Chitinophagaceae bacterium]